MCYNCGCNILDDNMGSQDNLTRESFEKAAKAMGQTPEEAKKETLKALKAELGEK